MTFAHIMKFHSTNISYVKIGVEMYIKEVNFLRQKGPGGGHSSLSGRGDSQV